MTSEKEPQNAEDFLNRCIEGIRDAATAAESDNNIPIKVPNEMKNWEIPLFLVRELQKQIQNKQEGSK